MRNLDLNYYENSLGDGNGIRINEMFESLT